MNRLHLALRALLFFALVALLMAFAQSVGAASMTIPSGATCTVTVQGGATVLTCAAVVTPTTPTNPNPPPPPPPPPPPQLPPGACPPVDPRIVQVGSFDGAVERTFRLHRGKAASMSFRLRPSMIGGNAPKLSTIETPQTPLNADMEMSVSACPGDFGVPCKGFVKFNGTSVNVSVGQSAAMCQFPPGTYYLNVRHARPGGIPSCDLADGCDVNLGIQNYRP